MWKSDPVFCEDMEQFACIDYIPWDRLRNKTILVTGATGLIGYTLVCALLYASEQRKLGLQILSLVRDEARARKKYAELTAEGCRLSFVEGSVEKLPPIDGPVHYIIHGASRTASRDFVEMPVETWKTALDGTNALLELAREKAAEGMVYLSSMEVYGYPERGRLVVEEDIGRLSPMQVRNCYPLGKIACESLCCSYASEYRVPVRIIRLTQTFGPGVAYHDGRVFVEFARCMVEKRNIVLKTKGETERSYLYTMDAVSAIMTVLLCGENGEAYSAANEQTYCSIAEMAEMAASMAGVKVVYELQDVRSSGYAGTLYMKLSTQKLQNLGWKPVVSLEKMYSRMLMGMQASDEKHAI